MKMNDCRVDYPDFQGQSHPHGMRSLPFSSLLPPAPSRDVLWLRPLMLIMVTECALLNVRSEHAL